MPREDPKALKPDPNRLRRSDLEAVGERYKQRVLKNLAAQKQGLIDSAAFQKLERQQPRQGGKRLPPGGTMSLTEEMGEKFAAGIVGLELEDLEEYRKRVMGMTGIQLQGEEAEQAQQQRALEKAQARPGLIEREGVKGPDTILDLVKGTIGELGDVPVVQQIFTGIGKIGAPLLAGASAAQRASAGDFTGAGEDLAAGSRAFRSALPFTDELNPKDFDRIAFSSITSRMGMKDKPTNFGLFGTFGFKDIVDLAGTFATDPLIVSKLHLGQPIGKFAKTGVTATAGEFGRSFMGFGPRSSAILGSDLRASILAKQRSLVSVHIPGKGRVAVRLFGNPKFFEAPFAEVFDMGRRALAFSKLGRMFNVYPGAQFRFGDAAKGGVNDLTAARMDAAADFWIEVEKEAARTGMTIEEAGRKLLLGTRKIGAPDTFSPGQKALRTRSGASLEQAKAVAKQAGGKKFAAQSFRDKVAEEVGAINGKAMRAARELNERADAIRKQADFNVRSKTLAADQATSGLSADELQQMGRPAPSGGLRPDPAAAKRLRREGNAIRTTASKREAALRRRAGDVLREGHKKSQALAKKKLQPAVKLERDADFMLRDLDARTPGAELPPQELGGAHLSAAEREAARLEARRLYIQYRNAGFNETEAMGAARAATMTGTDPIMAPFAGQMQDFFAEGFFTEIDAGIILSELSDPFQVYIKHAITDEGRGLLNRSPKLFNRAQSWFNNEFYANAPFAKKRNAMWEGMPVPEVNDWFRTHVPGFSKGTFFEENPLKIMQRRTLEAQGPLRAAALNDAAIGRWGKRRTPELEAADWASAQELLEEMNLQAHRKRGGGPAKDMIDVEAKRILDEELSVDLGKEAVGRPPALETARRQAIQNLLEKGEIVPTQFGRIRPKGGGDIRDILIPPEIAAEMRHVNKVWKDPKTPGAFLRFWDGANQLFRIGNTALWPAFHARNNIHNLWSVHLADELSLGNAKDAHAVLRSIAKNHGDDFIPSLGMKAKDYVQQLGARGGFGFSQAGAAELGGRELITRKGVEWNRIFFPIEDVERVGLPRSAGPGGVADPGHAGLGFGFTGKKARIAIAAAKAPFRVPARAGRLVGEGSEDFAKLMIAVGKTKKGATIDFAARQASKYLHNYSDLSKFEKLGMKRAVPFYTFIRKNVPLMLETLATKPNKIAQLAAIQRSMQGDHVDKASVPWHIQRGLFGFSRDPEHEEVMRIYHGAGLGFEDLKMFDSGEEFVHDWLNRMQPALKMILEQATNRDFFRRIPLDASEMAPSDYKHFAHMPGGKAFLDAISFRPVFKQGQLSYYRASPRMLNFLRNAPILNAAGRFFSTSERFVGEGADSPFRSSAMPAEPLKSLTGLSVRELNPQQQMLSIATNMARIYADHLREEVDKGKVDELLGRFKFRKDILSPDPEVREAQLLKTDLARINLWIAKHGMFMDIKKSLKASEVAALSGGDVMRGGGR